MRKGDEIRQRAFQFACDVSDVCDRIAIQDSSSRRIAAQLAGSSQSIGANLEEADAAQSRADFISKCSISLKEARESHYWLRVLHYKRKLSDVRLLDECNQIIAILTTIVRKTRGE